MQWLNNLVHWSLVRRRWRQLCKLHEKREKLLANLMQCQYGSLEAERLEPIHNRLWDRQDRMERKLGLSHSMRVMLEKLPTGRFQPPPPSLYRFQ